MTKPRTRKSLQIASPPAAAPVRGYCHHAAAWYANNVPAGEAVDDVIFGLYHPGGGTAGEMRMAWYPVGDGISPRLEIWDEAWALLAQMPEVLAALASIGAAQSAIKQAPRRRRDANPEITPEQLCAVLERLGFADRTPRTKPATEDLAPEGTGCPACGNRVMDELAYGDDDIVTCCQCGHRYDPSDDEALLCVGCEHFNAHEQRLVRNLIR